MRDVYSGQDTERPSSRDEEDIDDGNIEEEDAGDEYASEEEGTNDDNLVKEIRYTAVDLYWELQDWDETIRSIKQRGGNRGMPTSIPDGLLSLD
jgi:hypothetical protein